MQGSTYSLYINGLHRMTFEDNTFSAGMPGIYSWGGSTGDNEARFDNFRVTPVE